MKKYGKLYDYSEVVYTNARTKVAVKCGHCGERFLITPDNHLHGHGCPFCHSGSQKDTRQFVKKARMVHGGRYDYSKTEYKSAKKKALIICPIHGEFQQTALDHLHGSGCPACSLKKCHDSLRLNEHEFIRKAEKAHEGKYDYSQTDYIDADTKVKIVCPIHGTFWQRPYAHIAGQGCPLCAGKSKGEEKIAGILKTEGIGFLQKHTFQDLKDEARLQYDFYIPSRSLLIEYNGIQHYKAVAFFGGEKQLHLQRHHDWLKRKYAKDHGIRLLTVSCWEKDIRGLIEEALRS